MTKKLKLIIFTGIALSLVIGLWANYQLIDTWRFSNNTETMGSNLTLVSSSDLVRNFPSIYNSNLTELDTSKLEHSDLSGGTGISYATGTISFDCSEVEGTGINCTGEAITLDATGDWTGTFDNQDSSYYATTTHTHSQYLLNSAAASTYLSLTSWHSTTTDALSEGSSNLYWTDDRFDTRLIATSSQFATSTHTHPQYDTSNYLSLTAWYATTTDQITQGSTNLYWSDSLFDARLGASTSLPQLTTAENLTDIGTISQLDFTNASGTLLTVAGTSYLADVTQTGTSTITTGGVNVSGGCFAVDGTCLAVGGSGTVNEGTAGYVAYYAENGTEISQFDNIYEDEDGAYMVSDTTTNEEAYGGTIDIRHAYNTFDDGGAIGGGSLSISSGNVNIASSTGYSEITSGYNEFYTGGLTIDGDITYGGGVYAAPQSFYDGEIFGGDLDLYVGTATSTDNFGYIKIVSHADGDNDIFAKLDTSVLTEDRYFTFPDTTGTFAVIADSVLTVDYASSTGITATTLWGDIVGNVTGTASGNDILGQATSTLASHTTTYNHANYDTAYGWGDHASAGYNLQAFASSTYAIASGAFHDGFSDFVANEHIDWTTDQGATNIHAGNYTNTLYTAGDGLQLVTTTFSLDTTHANTFTGLQTFGNASSTQLTASVSYLGTILSGTWGGDTIGVTKGGTGLTTISAGGLLYGSAADTISVLASSTEGKVLKINAAGYPEWGEDNNTTYTAGDHLTLNSTDFDLDAEVITKAFQFFIATSTMGTTTSVLNFEVPVALTITEVSGYCLGGTTTLAIDERAKATPKTVGTAIFDDAFEVGDYVSTTTFSNASIDAGAWVNLDVDGYFVGAPVNCYLNIKGTVDD